MRGVPFRDELQSTLGKFARNQVAGLDIDGSVIFAVNCVEMRPSMLAVEEPDNDSEEAAHLRHLLRISNFPAGRNRPKDLEEPWYIVSPLCG